MKPLPEEFDGTRDQRGYHFKMLKRQQNVAIFEKNKPSTNPKGKFYEVIVVQQCPSKTWPDGRVTEAHETMPSAEKWGVLGYSYATLEEVMKRFEDMVLAEELK